MTWATLEKDRRRPGGGERMWGVVRSVGGEHKDVIHSVSFGGGGRRLATCGSDQSVRVWEESPRGQWLCSASWKTHSGSVWRVVWAHPDFGQILATCSFDRTALIWEEVMSEGPPNPRPNPRAPSRGLTHWVKRCTLVDSRSNLTDLAFAPRHLGLALATVSQTGMLRLYEAVDLLNVSQWSLQDEVSVGGGGGRCSAVSWSQARSQTPLIAIASDEPAAQGPPAPTSAAAPPSSVQLFHLQEKKLRHVESVAGLTEAAYDVSFAPALGRSFQLLAVASKYLHVLALRGGEDSPLVVQEVARLEGGGAQMWRVSWNLTGSLLASSASDGALKLWRADHSGRWGPVASLSAADSRLLQTLSTDSDASRYY